MTEEEKISDLKANFDYVLEGKDFEIKELKDRLAEEVELHLHAEEYIKGLEQKLEQTEKDLADFQFNYPKIKELEKENAELNRQLEEADNATDCFNRQEEIIEQAKELLKNIIRVTWGEGWNYSLDWKVKAEQFLSVVEK